MSSGKDGASRWPGSPKTEGTGKKGAAAQQQVCGQKLLPQHCSGWCPASRGSEPAPLLEASSC